MNNLFQLSENQIRDCLAQGKWPFEVPYGYIRVDSDDGIGTLVADDIKWLHVWDVFRFFASGRYSLARVQHIMEVDGFRVSIRTLKSILRNPFYAGKLQSPYSDWQYFGEHERVVSWETFEKVQQLLDGPGKRLRVERRYRRNNRGIEGRKLFRKYGSYTGTE